MNVQITWAGIGVIIAVLLHAFYTIRWSSKLETTVTIQLTNLTNALVKLDNELSKRDARITAAWNKIDNHNERIIKLESKVGAHE